MVPVYFFQRFTLDSNVFWHRNFVQVLFYSSSQLLPFESFDVCWKPFRFFVVLFPSLVHINTEILADLSAILSSVNIKSTHMLFVSVLQVTSSILEWKLALPLHETGMKFQTQMKCNSGIRTSMNSIRNEVNLIQDSCEPLKKF